VQVLSVTPGRVDTAMHEQLRAAPDDQLPDRPEFTQLHEEGLLRDPSDVATQLWLLLDDPAITSGQVLDLPQA
jgi:NAD(P)-dependent dehydrogenase (short-subunit alcohol dehydrogenase family)